MVPQWSRRGDNSVLSRDVADVSGELGYEIQVIELPR
jgi:hypothetical protein